MNNPKIKDKCPRCMYELGSEKFTEQKHINCPYCGTLAYRVSINRKPNFNYERYSCINIYCGIVISIRTLKRKDVN